MNNWARKLFTGRDLDLIVRDSQLELEVEVSSLDVYLIKNSPNVQSFVVQYAHRASALVGQSGSELGIIGEQRLVCGEIESDSP